MSQWYICRIFRHFSTLFICIFLDFPLCFMLIPLFFPCIYGQFTYLIILNWFYLHFFYFFKILTSHLGRRDKLLILGAPTTTGDYLQGGRWVWVLISPSISLSLRFSWALTSALSSSPDQLSPNHSQACSLSLGSFPRSTLANHFPK